MSRLILYKMSSRSARIGRLLGVLRKYLFDWALRHKMSGQRTIRAAVPISRHPGPYNRVAAQEKIQAAAGEPSRVWIYQIYLGRSLKVLGL